MKQVPHHRGHSGHAAISCTTQGMMPNIAAQRLQRRLGSHVQPVGSQARKVATSGALQRCAIHIRSGTGPHRVPHVQPRLGISRPASTASQPVASPGAFLGSSVYFKHPFCIQGLTRVTAVLSQGSSEATGKEPRQALGKSYHKHT